MCAMSAAALSPLAALLLLLLLSSLLVVALLVAGSSSSSAAMLYRYRWLPLPLLRDATHQAGCTSAACAKRIKTSIAGNPQPRDQPAGQLHADRRHNIGSDRA
jgi:hypothetical protein